MGISEGLFKMLPGAKKEEFFDFEKKVLKNKLTGEVFNCGTFTTIPAEELRIKAQRIEKTAGGKFNIIERAESCSWARPLVDIAYLQSLPENKDAVFQIASNFNALELLGVNDSVEKQIDFIKDSGLDVTLINFSDSKITKKIRERLAFLANSTGGNYLKYKNSGEYLIESMTK